MKAPFHPAPLAFLLFAATLAGCGGNGKSGGVETTPVILVQPRDFSAVVGTPATFYVTATGTSLTYKWFKVVNGHGVSVSGGTSATLTLGKVNAASAGAFYVEVKSGGKTTTSGQGALTVVDGAVAPAITTQPASTTATVGHVVTLDVEVSGTNPTFQWSKDGVAISGATHPTYTLAAVAATDAGSYKVTVTNGLGTATSDAATLTVG